MSLVYLFDFVFSEGRVITAEFDKFFVVTTYVPNAGRKLVTLPKRHNIYIRTISSQLLISFGNSIPQKLCWKMFLDILVEVITLAKLTM